jgi:rhamnogalacturonyl hydrolase YesR
VVFISDRDGEPDVFSIPLMGGQAINLTQTPFAQEDTPVFSPDGLTIAFTSDREGDWSICLMSQVTGDDASAEEAISQVIRHTDQLQDPANGLYYHARDESRTNPAGRVYWGRGNGWALLADVEVLSAITSTHPLRSTILDIMQKQVAGLVRLQDASGLWHTVLTRSDSYLETSASALIGYALRRGVQEGWLDVDL